MDAHFCGSTPLTLPTSPRPNSRCPLGSADPDCASHRILVSPPTTTMAQIL